MAQSEDLCGSLSCDQTGEIVDGNMWSGSLAFSKSWSINQQNTPQWDHDT